MGSFVPFFFGAAEAASTGWRSQERKSVVSSKETVVLSASRFVRCAWWSPGLAKLLSCVLHIGSARSRAADVPGKDVNPYPDLMVCISLLQHRLYKCSVKQKRKAFRLWLFLFLFKKKKEKRESPLHDCSLSERSQDQLGLFPRGFSACLRCTSWFLSCCLIIHWSEKGFFFNKGLSIKDLFFISSRRWRGGRVLGWRTDLADLATGSWASLWFVSLEEMPPGHLGSAWGCGSNICSSTADVLAQLHKSHTVFEHKAHFFGLCRYSWRRTCQGLLQPPAAPPMLMDNNLHPR